MGVDEAGKTGYYRMLLAGIEKLDVVSISPARHFVMFDQPEKFAAALDGALATMVESQRRNEPPDTRARRSRRSWASRPGSACARPARRRTTASCWRRCPMASSSRPAYRRRTDIVHVFTASKAELAKNLARVAEGARTRRRDLGVVAEEDVEGAHRHHRRQRFARWRCRWGWSTSRCARSTKPGRGSSWCCARSCARSRWTRYGQRSRGCTRSQSVPYRSLNTATVPYGASDGSRANSTPSAL